jgi:hypothetical protein
MDDEMFLILGRTKDSRTLTGVRTDRLKSKPINIQSAVAGTLGEICCGVMLALDPGCTFKKRKNSRAEEEMACCFLLWCTAPLELSKLFRSSKR